MSYDLHPFFTSIPVSFILMVSVLEFINLFKKSEKIEFTCRLLLSAAMIGVVCSFFSGYNAGDYADTSFIIDDSIISNHHNYGRLLLFTMFPCLALKFISQSARNNKKFFLSLFYINLMTCLGLVFYCGYLGGQMVFEHGAGVKNYRLKIDPQNTARSR